MLNQKVLDFVRDRAHTAEITLSICTGALILGRAGLLDGIRATTHHGAVEELRLAAPGAYVHAHERVIDNGKTVVAAGVSSGIDASFHVVARLLGREVAAETARYIEYPLSEYPLSV
jgi:transcriptional regulator GlxA family with amidase domain